MRFYYISLISVMLLGLIWFIGTGLLIWLGSSLRKRWKRAWMAMVPLFLLLYVSPIAEELWIAWNFSQLCRKDAGIFVYKTVQVEGFYDATMQSGYLLVEKSGYQFMEHRGRDGQSIEHVEKINGEWKVTTFAHPTARYHYKWLHMNTPMTYKVAKTERVVMDSQTGEVLGHYLNYHRRAPWFFVHLDVPLMFCKEAEQDAREKGTVFGPRMVLIPTQRTQ